MSGTSAERHLGALARGGTGGLLGAVVSAVATFGLVIVVTRASTPAQAGAFFAATSLFLLLAAASGLGTDAGLSRFVLRCGSVGDVRRVLRHACGPALVAAAVASLVLLVTAEPVARAADLGPDGPALLRLLAGLLPVVVVADFALAASRALGTVRSTVLVDRLLRSSLQLAAGWSVLLAGGGLVALGAAWGAAYAVSAVAAVRSLQIDLRRHTGPLPGSGVAPTAREFWSFTWARGVARISQIGIQKADVVLVAVLLGAPEAAIYTVATRFVALGQFVSQALQHVLQPRFTTILVHDDAATLRRVFAVGTAWTVLLAWPIHLAVGTGAVAYLGVFGADYPAADGARWTVLVMAAAMLVAVASGPVDGLLLMAGRSVLSLGNAVIAFAVDLVLCVLLIPGLGIVGAAVAWAAAVLVRCSLAYLQVRHDLAVTPVDAVVLRAMVVAAVCIAGPVALVTGTLGNDPALWLVTTVVAGTAYLGVLWWQRRALQVDLFLSSLTHRRTRKEARWTPVA